MTRRNQPQRPWTDADDTRLRALYPRLSAGACAAALGRSRAAVKNRVHKLALQKTDNPGRFVAGGAPWNKGMKGIDIGGRATRFQPGQIPHTWRPIGHTRVTKDGYLQRKIADTRVTRRDYVGIHHLVWRMHGRSIPPGHALVFSDGDRRNFDINNLELIPRAELMRRNTVHNLPTELKEVVDLKRRLSHRLTTLEKRAHGQ